MIGSRSRLYLTAASAFVACLGVAAVAGAAEPGFDASAATEAYLSTLSAEDKLRSDAYFEGGYWLILWDLLVTLAVAWALLASGTAARLRDFVERRINYRFGSAVFTVGYVVLVYVLSFPFSVYRDFFREHQYGLANQDFVPWFGEQMIGLGLSAAAFAALIPLIYWAIAKSPRTWWVWGGGISAALYALIMLAAPVYILPLTNDYTPMDEGAMRDTILSLARANGVPADEVYQFDASEQSTRISANVSGLGGTMRIALNDNLLNGGSPAEIRAVMAHEMGHYVIGHAYILIVGYGLIFVGGFGFAHWGFGRALARWGAGWSVRGIGDLAGLPLLMALVSVYFFLMTPLTNSLIRVNESQADIFGLNAAREPDGFASIAMKLADYRKLDPGTWEEIILFDHPSGRTRVEAAMRWKAENLGE